MDAPQPDQPMLPLDAMPAGHELLLPAVEQRHRFTGEQVARCQERYQAIVRALGEGISVRAICRAFGVSHHTVAVIREREAGLIATEKTAVTMRLRRIVRLTTERLEEALEADELPVQSLPVVLGISVDKLMALEGAPTQVVEIRREADGASIKRAFAELAAAAATRQSAGSVVDVTTVDVPQVPSPESESGAIGVEPQETAGTAEQCASGVLTAPVEPGPFRSPEKTADRSQS
jgi:transposase-like protein